MWKKILKKNFVNIDKLICFLKLDKTNKEKILKNPNFNLNLPLRLAKKIKKNNIYDPIFRQFVPLKEEKLKKIGFCKDPNKEKLFQNNYLIQKYKKRALLISSNICSMHCRFCFRKNFSFNIHDFSFEKELQIIKKRKSLNEIILSGGDPLILENKVLKKLLFSLNKISHIKRIRFHTRLIVALPERIDKEFLNILSKSKKQIVFILHINHLNELDNEIIKRIKEIQALKIPVLLQSVLLKDINDDVHTLLDLYENLSNHGIMPYYLYHLDKVSGSTHFKVPIKKGLKIIKELKKLTSGYNIPRYVREIPKEKSKNFIL